MACREYTLPRDEDSSEPKGWIRGNTKNGPVLEVTTCCLQGKYGVEIRIMSVNKDNSHSWVRISHGLNNLVTNLNNKDQDYNNEQESSEKQFEEYALKLNAGDFASRSKAKAKPQRRDSASSSTRTIPIGERTWTDVEPGEYSISDCEVSKKLIYLLRHGSLPRENDGAIELWKIKDYLQDHFVFCHYWSDDKWKSSMAGGGGHKKNIQYCADSSGTILYLRDLQGHSGRNLIDPIPDGFFKYIYHVGCAIKLHSIINSVLIPGGQNLTNRQTVFLLLVDPMDKEHKDPDTIDLGAPRRAQYMHKAWKKHQNTVYWVDINLAQKKGLKFYQTRSNSIILHETLPAYCIPKVVRMETGEVIYEQVFLSPQPLPKISLKHDWMKELGSEIAQRPEGQVEQQVKSSQSNQPIPNPDRDRTSQPVVRTDRTGQPAVGTNTRTVKDGRKTSHSQEIDACSFHGKAVRTDRTEQPVVETRKPQTGSSDDSKSLNVEMAHDRTGQPVVETHTRNVPDGSQTRSFHESTRFNVGDETLRDRTGQPVVNRDESSHERTMLNEVNIDFRIPGLPHSVVKQAENSRVRELVKKIENHPHRHALQLDSQQNKAYNPFSAKSKKMIRDVGNVELFELFETDLRRNAKNAYHTGVKASSIAHAGIS